MIYVNGEEHTDVESVLALLAELGVAEGGRGVAVAIDGEVLPRSRWPEQQLADGSRVEVLGAIQGG